MKQSIILLLSALIAVIATSCHSPSTEVNIIGEWELVRITGGMAVIDITRESPHFFNYAYSDTIVFDDNGHYMAYKDGKVLSSLQYKLEIAQTIYSHDRIPVVEIGAMREGSYSIRYACLFGEDGNTLRMLMMDMVDGYNYEYHRVSS